MSKFTHISIVSLCLLLLFTSCSSRQPPAITLPGVGQVNTADTLKSGLYYFEPEVVQSHWLEVVPVVQNKSQIGSLVLLPFDCTTSKCVEVDSGSLLLLDALTGQARQVSYELDEFPRVFIGPNGQKVELVDKSDGTCDYVYTHRDQKTKITVNLPMPCSIPGIFLAFLRILNEHQDDRIWVKDVTDLGDFIRRVMHI